MMDRKMQQLEEVNISNLMLLAEVCCQESEKIHREAIFESFSRKKRSRSINPIKIHLSRCFVKIQHQETYEQKKIVAAAPKKPTSEKIDNNKRKRVDDVPTTNKNNSIINKKKKVKVEKPTSIPAWVDELARTHLQINPQAAVWICDKLLTDSDAREGLNRFFIPRENSTSHLLPALTSQEQGVLSQGITVMGLDRRGELWNLQLKYWSSVNMHVFQKEWFKLLKMNEFEPNQDTIQIWLCRRRHEHEEQETLYFLIGKKEE